MKRIICLILSFRKHGKRFLPIIVILSGFLMLGSIRVDGQPPVLSNGDKVRIYAPRIAGNTFVGNVTDLSEEFIQISQNGNIRIIPLVLISELQVSRGRKSNLVPATKTGFRVGALVGGLVSLGSAAGSSSGDFSFNPIVVVGAGVFLGGLAGAASGFIIGAATHSNKWERVQIKPSVSLIRPVVDKSDCAPAITFKLSLNP